MGQNDGPCESLWGCDNYIITHTRPIASEALRPNQRPLSGNCGNWRTMTRLTHGLEIDDQLKLGWLQNRQVAWLFAVENTAGVDTHLPKGIGNIGSIAHKTARRLVPDQCASRLLRKFSAMSSRGGRLTPEPT